MDVRVRQQIAINKTVADLGAGTLRHASGAVIALRPQSFAVLRFLLTHPGRVISKDELMAAVWPGIAVTDDSLVQCIHDIRDAIGDAGHRIVRTLPKRGYLLALPDEDGADRTIRRWWRPVLLAAMAVVVAGVYLFTRAPEPGSVPLVAVLPIEAMSGDESTRLLARGLTEDLITDLARFPEFGVISRNSTERYAGGPVDPQVVADELGAKFVIESSISRQDEMIRVTAQLIDPASGAHLWSERWDRPVSEVFAIQSEISAQVANRLGGGAGLVQEAGRIAAHRKNPASLDAYELYLLGTEKLEQVTIEDLTAAAGLLNRAVELDPGLARAWIELFHTHNLLADFGIDPQANRELAIAAAKQAVALDPGDAEAHAVRGMSLALGGEFARGKEEFETALRLAPNAAEILIFYSGWITTFGEPERGPELVERAIRLDPNYPEWANTTFGWSYVMAGNYEKAAGFMALVPKERHIRMFFALHAGVLAALERKDEAAEWRDLALETFPDISIETLLNEPGYAEHELRRIETVMRLAGFPLCAEAAFIATVESPRRLPECTSAVTASTAD